VGLWSFVDKNSTYWEEIYTDSLFWVYSDEVGILKRRYEIEKNIIKQRYLDGSAYLNYEILKASRNSILFICEGEKGELRRIDEIYDLDQITAGDTALKWKYVQDYRRRKFAWENRAGNWRKCVFYKNYKLLDASWDAIDPTANQVGATHR